MENRLADMTHRQGAPVVAPASGAPAFVNLRTDNPLAFLDLELEDMFAMLARNDLSEIDRERAEFTIETLGPNLGRLASGRGHGISLLPGLTL